MFGEKKVGFEFAREAGDTGVKLASAGEFGHSVQGKALQVFEGYWAGIDGMARDEVAKFGLQIIPEREMRRLDDGVRRARRRKIERGAEIERSRLTLA